MAGDVPEWVHEAAAAHAADHTADCLGTIRYIDEPARLRGVASVTEGKCVSLARPVRSVLRPDGRNSFAMELFFSQRGPVTHGSDRVLLEAHGVGNTHLDGLTHVGVSGTWHNGECCEHAPEDDRSLSRWGRHGLATRAVLIDIPAGRGTPFVEEDAPVAGDELDRVVDFGGVHPEPGDALLVYMGRDRFESRGGDYLPIALTERRAGLDQSAAEWIADHRISILCWDFLDAHGPGIDVLSNHMLIWAIGIALIDNCDLAAAAAALAARDTPTGLLTVGSLLVDGATGCMVNPLLLY